MERDGVLAATFFVGFPHADIAWAGSSAVVVTDGDAAKAKQNCHELLDMAWKDRAHFVYKIEPLQTSLARAQQMQGGPIVLLDHYDNCASGGTMDTMTVLGGILDAGLTDVAAFAIFDPQACAGPICDPACVQQMIDAGIGAEVTLALGGKLDMPALGLKGSSRQVSGRVKTLVDGEYRNEGPMARGALGDMGLSAVLDTGKVEIAVISRHTEPSDLAPFRLLGIDPAKKRYLMLKSRVHWRAGLGPLAKATVECAGTGVCTSDYGQLDFRRVRRPIYPLDPDAQP